MAVEVEERGQHGMTWKCLPDLELNPDTYMEDFKTYILPIVRPSWDPNNLAKTVFGDGLTNKLVAIYEKDKGLKGSDVDVLLLRINGSGTDIYINRDDEIINILALSKAGLNPPLYAQMKNGLCYGFAPGRPVSLDELKDEAMMRRGCRAVAKLHMLAIPEAFQGRRPLVWKKIDEWLLLLPCKFSDPVKDKCFRESIGSLEALKADIELVRGHLDKCQSPIVFCHNDLLYGNMIYDESTGEVTLIDLEYGGPNHLAFDIADHFCEFAGIENVDYRNYPDEMLQKEWIRVYLEEKAKLKGVQHFNDEEEITILYKEVDKFALAAHLFWTVWGLLQALHSTIDFNYIEYAAIRYAEFQRRKEKFLAL